MNAAAILQKSGQRGHGLTLDKFETAAPAPIVSDNNHEPQRSVPSGNRSPLNGVNGVRLWGLG